jgi:hypothetical protein
MSMRSDLETTILREPGTLYQELPNNRVSNIYGLQVINKTFDDIDFEIRLLEPSGDLVSLGDIGSVPAQSLSEGRFMVQLDEEKLTGLQTELTFSIIVDGEQIETVKTGFLGPAKN